MENNIKLVIHIRDVAKPIVLSFQEEDRQRIIESVESLIKGETNKIVMLSGDVFICPDYKDIKSILITTEK